MMAIKELNINDDDSLFFIFPSSFHDSVGSKEDLTTLLSCLHLMLVQRRRQVTDQRCMPFLKKLATLSLSLPPSAALPTLSIVRSILQVVSLIILELFHIFKLSYC